MIPAIIATSSIFKILKQNWHWLRWVAIAVVIILIAVFLVKCVGGDDPKLNEEQIQRVNQAIATNNKAELEKVFTEVKVEQSKIDGNMANARTATINATHDARKEAEAIA